MTAVRHVVARPGAIDTSVSVPGSKSVANRALICAALAQGTTTLSNLPDGDDTNRMCDALREMGLTVQREGSTASIAGGDLGHHRCTVNAGLAGTTSRFLVALSVVRHGATTIVGEEALERRPIGDLLHALRSLGAETDPPDTLSLPVTMLTASVHGAEVSIRGDVSSQFVSALMLIGPYLPRGLKIIITSTLVSRPYVEMTASVMSRFGAKVTVGSSDIVIAPGEYSACSYDIEPDFSSAAFPIAATVIRGGVVRLPGLARAREQGDKQILDVARSMGCSVEEVDGDVVVSRAAGTQIRPIVVNLSDASDLVPAVAVAAAFASGVSELQGIGFIRNKESDRLGDLASELAKLGAHVEATSDSLVIAGSSSLKSAEVNVHHDHRLAMALALVCLGGVDVGIHDPDVVRKSWPTYWSDMSSILGAR